MYYKIPNYTMKCRMYPNKEQAKIIDEILIGLRIAHNVSMYEMTKNFQNTKETKDKKEDKTVHFPDFPKLMKKEWLDKLRSEHEIINKIPSGALSSSVCGIFVDCKKAWETSGKKPCEYYKPQYYGSKKPRTSYSYQECGSKFERGTDHVMYVNLNKLGRVKIRGWNNNIRFGESHDKDFLDYMDDNRRTGFTVTVSRDNCGDYYFIIKLSDVYKWMDDCEKTPVGIDAGIKDIAITSDGDKYENKHFAKKEKRHKKILGRQCSRRYGWSNIKFREEHKQNPDIVPSKRYEEAVQKMRILDRKIARKREAWNNIVSHDIAKKHDLIAVEDLNVKGMMQNKRLAYALSDAAMYDVLNKISYKAKWYGGYVHEIGRFEPSSQLCSVCGYQNPEVKKLSIREWTCPSCGTHHDRDTNAAKNILKIALKNLNN